jgi:hypothetical protein
MSAVATRTRGWSKTDSYQAQAANQGRGLGVVLGATGDNYRGTAAGAGAQILGVQDEASVAAGDSISVVELGDAVAIAGAALTVGAYVKVTAAGLFIPVTGTAGGGENIAGYVKSAATASGDEFILFVLPSVL